MSSALGARRVRHALALMALLFGLLTVVAGTRVLAGADPGYPVFFPLLAYNTAMGFVYVGAGWLAWRRLDQGRRAAVAILLLNLIVLAAVWAWHAAGGAVAPKSVAAMALRSAIWLGLWLGFFWLGRHHPPDPPRD